MALGETTTEVPGSRRIWKTPCADCVEKRAIVPAEFDVVERLPAAHRVVDDVQHMIGFVIGLVDLKQIENRVDPRREAELLHEPVHDPDPAVRDGPRLVRDLELNVARPENRAAFIHLNCCPEAALDSTLLSRDLSSYVSVHSKSPPLCFGWW